MWKFCAVCRPPRYLYCFVMLSDAQYRGILIHASLYKMSATSAVVASSTIYSATLSSLASTLFANGEIDEDLGVERI